VNRMPLKRIALLDHVQLCASSAVHVFWVPLAVPWERDARRSSTSRLLQAASLLTRNQMLPQEFYCKFSSNELGFKNRSTNSRLTHRQTHRHEHTEADRQTDRHITTCTRTPTQTLTQTNDARDTFTNTKTDIINKETASKDTALIHTAARCAGSHCKTKICCACFVCIQQVTKCLLICFVLFLCEDMFFTEVFQRPSRTQDRRKTTMCSSCLMHAQSQ
jgi:hypothetical protein